MRRAIAILILTTLALFPLRSDAVLFSAPIGQGANTAAQFLTPYVQIGL